MPKYKSKDELEEEQEQEEQEDIARMLQGEEPAEEEQEELEETEEEEEVEEDQEETSESEESEAEEQEDSEEAEEESEETDTVQKLRERIEELSGQQEVKVTEEAEEEESEEEETRSETEEETDDPFRFVSPEKFDRIQSDPEAFNQFLLSFADKVRAKTREEVMQDIPRLVQETAQRQMTVSQKINEFYQSNPDLKQYRKYVGHVYSQIAADNPELSMDEVMEQTAESVRQDLALSEQAKDIEEEEREKDEGKPAFAPGSKGPRRGSGPGLSEQEKQIDNMINL